MIQIKNHRAFPPGPGVGRVRFLMVGVLLVVFTIHYMQRVQVGVLIADPVFLADLGLERETAKQGLLTSFFLLAYALTNLSVGSLGDRFGPRRIMALGIFFGGVAMLLGGLAGSFFALLGARLLLGFGHGIHYPSQGVFVRHWFPAWERGRANSIYGLGADIGPILAMPLFALVMNYWGWNMSFFLMAGLALVIALPAMALFIQNNPKESPWVAAEEKQYLAESCKGDIPQEPTAKLLTKEKIKELFLTPQIVLVILCYAAFLSIWFGLLTWMPQYLTVARGFAFTTMGFLSALPYILGMLGLLFAGFLSDRIGRRTPFILGGFTCTALFLYGAAATPNNNTSVLLLAMATGTISLFNGVFWAMVQDRLPGHLVGMGIGFISGVGNLLSAFSPMIIGWLIQLSGSYFVGVLYLVIFSALGALGSLFLVRREGAVLAAVTRRE